MKSVSEPAAMDILSWLARSAVVLALAACGGGGGGSIPTATSTPPGSSGNSSSIAAPADNVQPISVEPGPGNALNLLFTSVTVCAPNSSNCQVIDHVVVDTASTGLRIVASVLSPSLSLVAQKDSSNNTVVECAQFAGGYSWGPVSVADVKIAGEQASSIPIQVIGDPTFAAVVPTACSSTGPAHNSVPTLLANGILGVGIFRQDCGSTCVSNASAGFYYACPAGGGACQGITQTLDRQVQNPAALFANDNNGVIVQLPAIPATGAATVTGALVFGIGTRANNGLGNGTIFPLNPIFGTFVTTYKGVQFDRSFVDSGSNGLFFSDSAIPRCPTSTAFYCPSETLNLSATIQGTNGTTASIDFAIANTNALLQNNPSSRAFNNIGGPGLARAFDWGLPFYFGRNVYTAFAGASTPQGTGPYIAF
jgi:hypothetical protein